LGNTSASAERRDIMKRYLGALVLVGLMMWWTVFAEAASLSIFPNPLVASPGNSVLMSVDYNAQGAQVASLQFDLLYDPSVLSITTATAGSGAINASKTLSDKLISPGELRFIISGFNQNVFGRGGVVHLTVQVSNSAPKGPYSLFLCNMVASDPNGRSVPIKGTGGMNREEHKGLGERCTPEGTR
jgi:cohesin domain-containing protein